MRYAQTGIHAIGAVDGCPGHVETADPAASRFAVDCPVHEAWLARTRDPLWAATPGEVPLTETERKAADAAKQTFDAVAAQAVAGLAAAFAGGGLSLAQVAQAVPAGALPAAPQQPAAPAPAAATPKAATRKRATPKATAPA